LETANNFAGILQAAAISAMDIRNYLMHLDAAIADLVSCVANVNQEETCRVATFIASVAQDAKDTAEKMDHQNGEFLREFNEQLKRDTVGLASKSKEASSMVSRLSLVACGIALATLAATPALIAVGASQSVTAMVLAASAVTLSATKNAKQENEQVAKGLALIQKTYDLAHEGVLENKNCWNGVLQCAKDLRSQTVLLEFKATGSTGTWPEPTTFATLVEGVRASLKCTIDVLVQYIVYLMDRGWLPMFTVPRLAESEIQKARASLEAHFKLQSVNKILRLSDKK